MSDDVWKAAEGAAATGPEPAAIGGLFTEALEDLRDHAAGYALAGLGLSAVQVPLMLGMLVVYFAAIGASMFLARGQEETLPLALMAGVLVGLLLVAGPSLLVLPPLYAGLYRAVWAWQVDRTPLGFGAVFQDTRRDLPAVWGVSLLTGLAVFAGMLMCYVPAIFALFFLHFAFLRVAIHRRSPTEALQDSWGHVAAHPGWNLAVYAISFAISFTLSNIPVVGMVLSAVLLAAWNLRCYRVAFPEL